MLHDIDRLRGIIGSPQGCGCALSDEALYALLARYPCYELAAYHACVMMAREDSLELADGTHIPSQREYWLTRARELRPSRTGTVVRADEVTA